jgi:hypothetical protein
LTDPNRRPKGAGQGGTSRRVPAGAAATGAGAAGASTARPGATTRPSSSPGGTRRAGRRETARRRYDRGSFLERNRSRLLAIVIVGAVVLVGAWFVGAASQPAYACSSIFPADAPVVEGQIGAVQEDMGNLHVAPGTTVRYTYCPPASGNHVNQRGFGPIDPKFYGPDDRTVPEGWVHNLEHGAVVVLYSCGKGACDQASLDRLRQFIRQWDAVSPVCHIPPNTIGPVVARFEDMAKPYAALLWDRVLYMDTFDAQKVKDFYLKEGEYLDAGKTAFVAPPEPQCAVPSPSVSSSPSASGPASPVPSGSASSAPSGSASAVPSSSASPSAASPSASAAPSSS